MRFTLCSSNNNNIRNSALDCYLPAILARQVFFLAAVLRLGDYRISVTHRRLEDLLLQLPAVAAHLVTRLDRVSSIRPRCLHITLIIHTTCSHIRITHIWAEVSILHLPLFLKQPFLRID
jgi:hypothetical protein